MTTPPQTPFATRRRVVLLDGASEAGSLTDHLADTRGQFESRGFDVVVIDLKAPGSDSALIAQVESGLVRFCFGLSGFGAELSVTHAHGTASFWDYARTPYVGVMPDSPVFVPSRHRLASRFVLFLYSDPVHLDIASSIGSPLTTRALVAQAGFPPADPPAPFSKRDIAVVYAKAGGDPEEIRRGWRALPARHREFIEEVVAACCWTADVSIWHSALDVARAMGQPEHTRGDAFCHAVSQCELYVRRARASRVLEELLHLPVLVSGGDWAHLDWSDAKATLGPRVPLLELRALFGRSKIVLNAMPALRFSTHHRMIEGMLHGAAAASDANSWLDTVATRDRYIAFDWAEGSAAHAVRAALADETALVALAERGRAFALTHHDPHAQFDHMLKTVDEFLARAGGTRE
ncbi:MAG: glycosyltransferase [Gemmatimonadales bacterium]